MGRTNRNGVAGGPEVPGRLALDYHLTLVERPSYLHAKVTGSNESQNVLRFLQEAYDACVQRGQIALLLELDLSGPSLGSSVIFSVVTQRSADGAKLRKIAYIDARDSEKAKFAETVAVNRGVNVRLFRGIGEAERWLVET